jgi:hypothetical protein
MIGGRPSRWTPPVGELSTIRQCGFDARRECGRFQHQNTVVPSSCYGHF